MTSRTLSTWRGRLSLWLVAVALISGTTSAVHSPLRAEDKKPDQASKKPDAKLPPGVRLEYDLSYIPDGVEAQRLDLYLPEKATDKPLPVIVHIHGGGWRAGSKFPCGVAYMAARGYAVASVEYRFSQDVLFPAQIQDCQAAIRWLRAHSKDYNLDVKHFGAIGGSAGGHLSALVGTAGGKQAFPKIGGNEDYSDRVQCVCDIFGPADFATVIQQAADDKNVKNVFKFNSKGDPYSDLLGVSLDADKDKTASVSPVHYVSDDSPPMLILHGTHDALVPYAQSEELEAALKAKGVPVWLQKFPGSGHGGPAFAKPAAITLMTNFFDKYLQGAEVEVKLVPPEELAVEPPKAGN